MKISASRFASEPNKGGYCLASSAYVAIEGKLKRGGVLSLLPRSRPAAPFSGGDSRPGEVGFPSALRSDLEGVVGRKRRATRAADATHRKMAAPSIRTRRQQYRPALGIGLAARPFED